MKFVLSIYDHGVVMHVKFCQDILSNRSYCPLKLFTLHNLALNNLAMKLVVLNF